MMDSDKRYGLLSLLVLAIYAAIQAVAINAPWFPADDAQELAFVRSFDHWWQLFGVDTFGLFRPVKNIAFSLFAFLEPLGMPVVRSIAIAIGIATFFPVRAFFGQVFPDRRFALMATAIWMLSPTLVSSVVWLSCINIQIMCGFAAGAILLHDRGRQAIAALLLFLGCFSYESAVAIGPCIVVFDFFLRPNRIRERKAWGVYALYAGVTLGFLVLRHFIGSVHSVTGSFVVDARFDIIMASAYFTCQHFLTWLYPFGRMAVFGGYICGDVSICFLATCWLVIVAALVISLTSRKRYPTIACGVALAIVGFLPVSNVTGVGNGPYGDYYLCLSSLGLSMLVVGIVNAVWKRKAPSRTLSLSVAAILIGSRIIAVPEAARWSSLWSDGDRADAETLMTFPRSFQTLTSVAGRACEIGDWQRSLACCDMVESLVGANSAKNARTQLIRALVELNGMKNADRALAALDRAEQVAGSESSIVRMCHFYRGCVYEDLLADNAKAEREYSAAIPMVMNSDAIQAADRLARLLAIRGDFTKAESLWSQALRIQPNNLHVATNLAILRRSTNAASEK